MRLTSQLGITQGRGAEAISISKPGGATAWTNRNKKGDEFMAVKKLAKKKAAEKFEGVRGK